MPYQTSLSTSILETSSIFLLLAFLWWNVKLIMDGINK
jgi:hypothetical protein